MTFRDEWAALTFYNENDLVTVANLGLYLVLQSHTSDASFDPDASNTAGDYYQLVFGIGIPSVESESGSSYTMALADNGKIKRMTNAGGCTVHVPNDTDVAFLPGMSVDFEQTGAAPVSFIDGGDTAEPVTINYRVSANPETLEQYAVVRLTKVDANEWTLSGDLSAGT
jgi:hypothetical protein